jgi:hypothetical protein
MTYRTGNPSLRRTVKQIGFKDGWQQPAIENNGRAVRLKKGKGAVGETIYDIRTRPVGKGREWNFARRIAQEKALVERFEKEIDSRCNKNGMGKKLAKSVGAYDKFLNPKMNAVQLAKLDKRADQIAKVGSPPPGLKVQFDENDNLMWVGRFEMDAQSRTTIKSDLATEFRKTFQKPKHKGDSGQGLGISGQCRKDWNRSDRLLNGTNLRDCQEGEITTELRNFVGGSGVAAHNLSVLLTQAVFGGLLLAYRDRTGFVVLDSSRDRENNLTFDAKKKNDDDLVVVTCTSKRKAGMISHESDQMYYFDQTKSVITESITLASDLGDLGNGNAKGVKVAGDPSIDFVLYPIPKEESTI